MLVLVKKPTFSGSKESTLVILKGTQTLPVLGWITNGAFSKWFIPFDTAMSSLTVSIRTVKCQQYFN